MRPQPIYPQQFGDGIPNPVGPPTFRGLERGAGQGCCSAPPQNWGPLVTRRLGAQSGDMALFSTEQWEDISK